LENSVDTPAIEIQDLSKQYKRWYSKKGIQAVQHLSLSVGKGQVFALAGPNGAGKSTTIHCLVGLFSPDTGSISVLGRDPREPQAREKIGYQSEVFYTYGYLTAEQVLLFHAELLGLSDPNDRVKEVLEKVQLTSAQNQKVGTFSKGMTQRLGLAQSLLGDPEVLIWDEPSTGLDHEGRKMVIDLIQEKKMEGKTILFSTHVLSDIEKVCDSIAIIKNGELLVRGAIPDLCSKANVSNVEDLYLHWMKGETP